MTVIELLLAIANFCVALWACCLQKRIKELELHVRAQWETISHLWEAIRSLKEDGKDETIRELLKTAACPVWITSDENPLRGKPELKIDTVDIDAANWLSDWLLDRTVYLIIAEDNAIYVSLYLGRKDGDGHEAD